MKKPDPKIFLLNLLDDNKEKISYISETKCSKELFGIYQELQNFPDIDNKTDYSNIHDYSVKEKILKHKCLSSYHKYKIAISENNESLKTKVFNDYFKSQWIFNPIFLFRVLKYKSTLPATSSRVTIFLSAWQGLTFSLITSFVFTNLWFLPLVFIATTSLSWFLILQTPRKIVSEFLEITGLGLFLMVMIPLIVPLLFCLGFGALLMLGVEQLIEKAYTKSPYSNDEDEDPMYRTNRWDKD